MLALLRVVGLERVHGEGPFMRRDKEKGHGGEPWPLGRKVVVRLHLHHLNLARRTRQRATGSCGSGCGDGAGEVMHDEHRTRKAAAMQHF
jgi:hypothetical protein